MARSPYSLYLAIGILLPCLSEAGWLSSSTPKPSAEPTMAPEVDTEIPEAEVQEAKPTNTPAAKPEKSEKTEHHSDPKPTPTPKVAQPSKMTSEWKVCQKSFYDLMEQRQQIAGAMDNKKKNPCKKRKHIRAKKLDCPEDRSFGEFPADFRSQIDALMVGESEDYPFKDDLSLVKVYHKVVEHLNKMIDQKCDQKAEYDESSL